MSHGIALLIALAFLAYALCTRRLGRTVLTGPLLFAALGFALGPAGLHWVDFGFGNGTASGQGLHDGPLFVLAEITLVLVLFTDAASTDLGTLSRVRSVPTRMLLIGLPLAVALGTLGAALIFPALSIWEAALLAAILAPTDAALSQPVIENEAVPSRIRAAITTESGVNDGLALPAVLLFAALAAGANEQGAAGWAGFVTQQLVFGPLAGVLVGGGGGWLIQRAWSAGWMDEWAEGLAALTIALSAFLLAETLHGNGFLAAFVGGLAMARMLGKRCRYAYEFQQSEAHILVLGTFFLVGALMLPAAAEHLTWWCAVYALFALTAMRMLPIAVSLLGTRLDVATVAFLGWFGPRGLASVLFALIILERADVSNEAPLLAAIALTVTLSILVHGVSAAPMARRYGRSHRGGP